MKNDNKNWLDELLESADSIEETLINNPSFAVAVLNSVSMNELKTLIRQAEGVQKRLENLKTGSEYEPNFGVNESQTKAGEILNCAYCIEKLALDFRKFCLTTTLIDKNQLLSAVCETMKISVSYLENNTGVLIKLPVLEHRKDRRSGRILCEPLRYALRNFAESTNFTPYTKATIIYRHIVPMLETASNRSEIGDYDNLETKRIQDEIATFLLIDDNMALIDTIQSAAYGDGYRTEIVVLPYRISETSFGTFSS